MTEAEKLFHDIAASIDDAKEGKMFGAMCIKAEKNGKAAAMFWREHMVFKLDGDDEREALALSGAHLFDPMDGRPMKHWVVVPFEHYQKWPALIEKSMEIVRAIPAKK